MRQKTYLNVILTVNAVLLSAIAWVQLSGQAVIPGSAAQAQSTQDGGLGSGTGIPNAGAQRQKMIETLRDIDSTLLSMRKTLEGKVKVEVSNVSEFRSEGE